MRHYVRSILVEDVSGARFQLHEYAVRRLIRVRRYFELDTGELARPFDGNTFVLARTGEHLLRVDRD